MERAAGGGTYLELMSGERLRYNARFDDSNLPGEMQTTVTLAQVSCGRMSSVQEGISEMLPPEARYLGWQEPLTLLMQSVEPAIPGGYWSMVIIGDFIEMNWRATA